MVRTQTVNRKSTTEHATRSMHFCILRHTTFPEDLVTALVAWFQVPLAVSSGCDSQGTGT